MAGDATTLVRLAVAEPLAVPDHLLLLTAQALQALVMAEPAVAVLLVETGLLHLLIDALALELRQALTSHADITLASTFAAVLAATLERHPVVADGAAGELSAAHSALALHFTLTGSLERLGGLCASVVDPDAASQRAMTLPLLHTVLALAQG